jgi:DNA-binding response OmpR family regulator
LRALQRRSPQLQPTQLHVGNLVLDYKTSTVSVLDVTGTPQQIPLTAKEFQLLECFMQHPNQILSRDQILSQLWQVEADSVSNVVAAQTRLLRRKLTQYGLDHLIETVYGMGYRFNTHESE